MAIWPGAPHLDEPSESVKHLREREQLRTEGYYPTQGSGVTISTGVDLGQQSEEKLKDDNVPQAIIDKVKPYLGLKSKAAVERKGLKAENLVLTEEEATTLEKIFVDRMEKLVEPYGQNMGERGKAVLVSLRHWAGSLGNSRGQGKLSLPVNGKNENYVWDAIKNQNATLADLKAALEKTAEAHKNIRLKAKRTQRTAAENRIRHEIDYINK